MVNKPETDENAEPYSHVVLRREILFQPLKELSGRLVVSNLDKLNPQLSLKGG